MKEQSIHNIILYTTLVIAVAALIVGIIGLVKSGQGPEPSGSVTPGYQQGAGNPGETRTVPITGTGPSSGSVDSSKQ
jgi:hypothetical protein